MIKIDSKKAKDTAEIFYEAVKPYVCLRLEFVIKLLEQLENGDVKLEKLINSTKGLGKDTAKAIIKPLLTSDAKKEYKDKDKGKDIGAIELIKSLSKPDKRIFDTSKFDVNQSRVFFETVQKNLETILKKKPKELNDFSSEKGVSDIQKNKIVKGIIEKIFNYELLTDKGFSVNGNKFTSYTLTSSLDLSVCVYCNRNWIVTIKEENGKKVTNPQLDHFFSKSDFPILRLSFYNLIPSCETCNARLKNDVEFVFNENLHPYLNGYKDNAKFKVHPKSYEAAIGKAADYKVDIDIINGDLKTSIEKNHDTFKINEIYEKHGDIISEIYRKKYVYNEKYLEKLKDTFSIKVSNQELYKLLLNNYITEEDFHKRPFALLIHDLTKDLSMI